MEMENWMTGKAAAEVLGVSLQAVYALVFRKRLRKLEGERRLFVLAEDVGRWKEEQERVAERRRIEPPKPRRKQGRPEEADWISVERAARMVGCTVAELRVRACYKRWEKRKVGRKNFVRIGEVEAVLRDPDRLRREVNRERTLGRQRFWEVRPHDAVGLEEAADILVSSVANVKRFVYRGRLGSFQAEAGVSKHWLRRSEVEMLREELAGKRAERARREEEFPQGRPMGCSRAKMRRVLPRGGTVEVGDLSEWERYMGDWITTRQAAWLLHVTQRAVCSLRQSGRLAGRMQETLLTGREQWHFRKADVLALMGEDGYLRRHRNYGQYSSPEARERREAEREAAGAAEREREWEVIEEMRRWSPPGQAVREWLREQS